MMIYIVGELAERLLFIALAFAVGYMIGTMIYYLVW